jgi:serine/threonine-protein phosphatase 2A regulatory subunit B'|eukprot:g3426.t1
MQEFTGYLYKQGGERKNWKKRWFILRGNCLSYFNSSEDETPIKSFELNGYDIHEVPYEKFKKKMCFELFHTSERTYYMYAEHVDEHEKWLSQLAVATMPMAWGGVHRQELSTQGDGALLPQEITHKAAEEIAQLGQFERLRNVKSWQRRALLRKKMLLCSIHLPFRGSSAPAPDGTREYEKEKEAKRLALLELVDYIDNMRNAFNDPQAVCDVINMIVCNICRALPARDENADEEEEEEHFMEPTWPHLSIVYELLLRIVQSNDIDLALKKKYIDTKFIIRLLDLFDSFDYREREALKTITHRIYGKLTNRRALIRRAISNVFFTFVYETEKHNGIAELLEILGSIINGFAVPVKQDHVKLLERALIPLHACKAIRPYHPVLSYCMSQYVNKEQRFAIQIVEGILKCWPQGNSDKEMLFLNELEEVIEVLSPSTFASIEVKLYQRIASCIRGEHFQVSERALHMWGNEILNQIVVEDETHRRKILPIVFPALASISEEGPDGHWQQSVRDGAVFVMQRYEQQDSRFYTLCQTKYEEAKSSKK